jgi:hypothetical protein
MTSTCSTIQNEHSSNIQICKEKSYTTKIRRRVNVAPFSPKNPFEKKD